MITTQTYLFLLIYILKGDFAVYAESEEEAFEQINLIAQQIATLLQVLEN